MTIRTRSTVWTVGLLVLAAAPAARAQNARGGQAKPPVTPTANSVPPSGQDLASQPASTTPMPVPQELLETHEGGLTAEQVGRKACDTSFSAKQSLETMRAAEARVDQAWAGFMPRLQATARYTHLSNFTPPSFGSAPANLYYVGTNDPSFGQPGHVPGAAGSTTTAFPFQVPNITFPLVLDNYLLQATLTVPISDYFLKTNQAYSQASHSAEAARFDVGAARATAFSNGKIAYYTWLQARGQVIVAIQTLNDQRAHLNDIRNQFAVGNANKADTLRAETAVANAELQVETARNAADLAETQMRIAIHSPTADKLLPGEGLDVTPPRFQGNLQGLVAEGVDARYEVKSITENALAARKQAASIRGAGLPSVSAFGDGIYGNPNPRVFPQTATWFPTWDVGVQALWAPNDFIANGAGARDYESRANALEAAREVTREGIEVEITQAYEQVRQWDIGIEQTRRELASAEEAARVARELFNNGRGTALTLADAETDLTRARLDALNATVNARVARVRLDHAVGRDLKVAVVSP